MHLYKDIDTNMLLYRISRKIHAWIILLYFTLVVLIATRGPLVNLD